jgi:hypothetical protein
MTRSFVAAAHSDWTRSVAFNPLGPALFLLTALQIPFGLMTYWAPHCRAVEIFRRMGSLLFEITVIGLIFVGVWRFVSVLLINSGGYAMVAAPSTWRDAILILLLAGFVRLFRGVLHRGAVKTAEVGNAE